MVALVQQTFNTHPTFFSLPRVSAAQANSARLRLRVRDPDDDMNYVKALYRACGEVGAPTGRRGNDLVVP